MFEQKFSPRVFGTGLVAASVLGLAACGGGADSSSTQRSGSSNNSVESRANVTPGPLDPIQDAVVTDVIGSTVGSALPAPLGPTVSCLADALNSLIDGPDAILAAASTLPSGADPASAFQGAADDVVGSMERFAAELQDALGVLAGQNADCSTVAGGGGLPGLPGTGGGNPLAGTPLEAVGDALMDLTSTLGDFSGSDEDPDLTSVSQAVQPVLDQLSAALAQVPPEVADAPVVGGLFSTLSVALDDVGVTLDAAGQYDANGTQLAVEGTLNNLLTGVLLDVVPVRMIDEQTGQDFSTQIEAGIQMATAALGEGLGQVITPAFNDLLNGALEPVLDPVEGVLAMVLGQIPGGLEGGNPLDGLLGGLAGDGSASPLDALLGLVTMGSTGNPLSSLTDLAGGNSNTAPIDQLAFLTGGGAPGLDSVLGTLANATAGVPLLGPILNDVLDSLVGGLAQN